MRILRAAYPEAMAARTSAALGEIIRRQRDIAGISNPYLSQIERGLRAPSQHVLDAIAGALSLTSDALYEQAGMTPPGAEPEANAVLDAINADPRLTSRQRKALAEIYESFVASSSSGQRNAQ